MLSKVWTMTSRLSAARITNPRRSPCGTSAVRANPRNARKSLRPDADVFEEPPPEMLARQVHFARHRVDGAAAGEKLDSAVDARIALLQPPQQPRFDHGDPCLDAAGGGDGRGQL